MMKKEKPMMSVTAIIQGAHQAHHLQAHPHHHSHPHHHHHNHTNHQHHHHHHQQQQQQQYHWGAPVQPQNNHQQIQLQNHQQHQATSAPVLPQHRNNGSLNSNGPGGAPTPPGTTPGTIGLGGHHAPWLSLDNSNMSMGSAGPQSPLDIKPDTASLMTPGSFSPSGPNSPNFGSVGCHGQLMSTSSATSPGGQSKSSQGSPYPPNHPLSGSKHLCSICGDRASGKHYGVYSCEGCKGFFKRTVRKDLTYACREDKCCLIDKRQRNRCQYCRYQKCLAMGMKREAVQEERQRTKDREQNEVESTSGINADMPIEKILEAEKRFEYQAENQQSYDLDSYLRSNKQLAHMVEWAKHIPHFTSLPLEDQVMLLRSGWNELLIAAFSHRSMDIEDGIVLTTGLTLYKNSAQQAGVGSIFDRVLIELVQKMKIMAMDKTELGCLRAIILLNPEIRGLKAPQEVDLLRERVYTALDDYLRLNKPDEPGRFAKLLLRLPALRSIGLKCMDHLFFFGLQGDGPIDDFLADMLESPSSDT